MNSVSMILTICLTLVGCNNEEFTSSGKKQPSGADQKKKSIGSDPKDGSDGGSNDGGGNGSKGDNQDGGGDGLGGDTSGDDVGGGDDANGDDSKDKNDGIKIEEGELSDKCDVPKGQIQQQAVLGGEDVPGNGLLGGPDAGKPFGSDFDDFVLTLSGEQLIEKDTQGAYAKIGFSKKAKVNVVYARGTSDCSHKFKFMLRKCPNKNSTIIKTVTLDIGQGFSGSRTIEVPAGKLFLDIEISASSSTSKKFGGCSLPFPITNLLYGGGVPVLIQ